MECGSDRESWMVLVDRSKRTGKTFKPKKKSKKPKNVIDPNYNPKDYPNETQMTTKDVKIASGIKYLDQTKQPNDKRAIRRAPENKIAKRK